MSAPTPANGSGAAAAPRSAPARPTLANPNAAPVIVKRPPPFFIRLSQLLWVASFAAGGAAVVYFFIVRKTQLPLIADAIRAVDDSRTDSTYESAADIVFWSVFAVMLTLLLIQITLLVSFTSRRPRVRWWQLATWVVQALLYLLAADLVGGGTDGELLRQLLVAQCGLVLLALLSSTTAGGIAWSVRQHDVRRGAHPAGPGEP